MTSVESIWGLTFEFSGAEGIRWKQGWTIRPTHELLSRNVCKAWLSPEFSLRRTDIRLLRVHLLLLECLAWRLKREPERVTGKPGIPAEGQSDAKWNK